jgi:hypothetical protein
MLDSRDMSVLTGVIFETKKLKSHLSISHATYGGGFRTPLFELRFGTGFFEPRTLHLTASGAFYSLWIDFGRLSFSSKKLLIHNFLEHLGGERFRAPVLRREVRLEINAVAKALRWLDGADAECRGN